MLIIPAIDIMDSKVVRLNQGKKEDAVVYSDNPVSVAKKWQNEGAQWLHLVDIDGAFTGNYKNWDTIENIIKNIDIFVELGGGIRTDEAVKIGIDAGAQRIILGTKAAEDKGFIKKQVDLYGAKIAVAIDYKNRYVSARGWGFATNIFFIELAKTMEAIGVSTIICTDITRDGMLSGPNISSLTEILKAVDIQIIASGGISSLQDLLRLKELNYPNLCGAIVGKALYEGKFSLKEAINACKTDNTLP